jgi:carbamoyl-phosphate synthase large subunit
MPRRTDIGSVMVIGSGPIVIGQAAEFDYSGTQACRVLRSEGVRVVLVNSNPATIMTDPQFADATYVEPITAEFVARIIERERPDAMLATLGGQTALNVAMALHADGTLDRYGVELIGANTEAIERGENRERFKEIVAGIGAESAASRVCHSMDECLAAVEELGYPVVVRPSFTMGGAGSGMAHNAEQLHRIAGDGLAASPTTEVLLEESILGWKEFELELMRDRRDNVVVVCSIENVDPMGVHTGDSITVAPALTLTDREYQNMRDIGIAIIRAVGVDTGGCNIQFAVNPLDGRIIVIEMNPRVSRSSALASKATGFPIAKIAARLAIGYTLDEIPNDITGVTPASFEPTLDYIVVKVPRFAFEKFPSADPELTTHMKSVGEAMAIGRNFTEALQKALRSLEKREAAFSWVGDPAAVDVSGLLEAIRVPHDGRLEQVQQALWAGATIEDVHAATAIDPWFLDQIALLNEFGEQIRTAPALTPELLRATKRHGFSDAQIGAARSMPTDVVRGVRHALGIRPVYKTVDTCAAEFAARTPYHYSTYDEETEVEPRERPAVIILGSGPNRIGQGIEFDYSCVHACMALREVGYETVMINCNPETVSTDYDTASRLYFEPLTLEDVLEVYHAELAAGPVTGVICQLGGQTPLGLAHALKAAGVPILGTSPEAIDLAEERGAFGRVLVAAKRLSADVINFSAKGSSLSKGENLKDTALTLQAMGADAVVIRHGASGAPHRLATAGWIGAAVVNAGDGTHEHPTQALLDAYTIREHLAGGSGDLTGLNVTIVGDVLHSRVARSNVLLLHTLGARVTLVAPPTLMPVGVSGWPCETSYDLDAALPGTDALMMLRVQSERMAAAYFPSQREYARRYGLDAHRADLLAEHTIVMHPGPMNRGMEIAASVADGPRSVIIEQVANGVSVRMAVLYLLLGGADEE